MVATGGAGEARRRPELRTVLSEPAVVAALAVVGGAVARWWMRRDRVPVVWNDSFDYAASAATPWLSAARWLGPRPALMPGVLSLVHGHYRTFVTVQTVVAAVAWGLLAAAVGACLPAGWRRWVAAGAIVLFSLSWPIAMWDQEVLTESLALSSLALLCAAVVQAARGLTPRRGVLLVAAAVPALMVRDSHVVPIAVGAIGLGAWSVTRAVLAWSRARRGGDHESSTEEDPSSLVARLGGTRVVVGLVVAGYLLALATVTAGSAQWGHRDRQPLEHVYAVRVLPFPERVAWFADHGMPNAEEFSTLPPVAVPADEAPYISLSPLPAWEEWRVWLGRHGRSALARYALAHPSYLWDEPMQTPERVFNNGDGLTTYAPAGLRKAPATGWADLDVQLVIAVLGPTLVLASWRRVVRTPPCIAGLVLVATSLPHALVAWHSDGMEAARHLLIPATQLRVGVLLVVLAAVLAPRGPEPEPRPRGTGRWPRARSSDHQRAPGRPAA